MTVLGSFILDQIAQEGLRLARQQTTERLKELWDSYDGIETKDSKISGEDVHQVLNERGEGHYCAV